MKSRTCPHCNYKYSIGDYFTKLTLKDVWTKWKCINCKNEITFDFTRRIIVALGLGALVFGLSVIKNNVEMTIFWWFGMIAVLVVGATLLYGFDTFKKAS